MILLSLSLIILIEIVIRILFKGREDKVVGTSYRFINLFLFPFLFFLSSLFFIRIATNSQAELYHQYWNTIFSLFTITGQLSGAFTWLFNKRCHLLLKDIYANKIIAARSLDIEMFMKAKGTIAYLIGGIYLIASCIAAVLGFVAALAISFLTSWNIIWKTGFTTFSVICIVVCIIGNLISVNTTWKLIGWNWKLDAAQ